MLWTARVIVTIEAREQNGCFSRRFFYYSDFFFMSIPINNQLLNDVQVGYNRVVSLNDVTLFICSHAILAGKLSTTWLTLAV